MSDSLADLEERKRQALRDLVDVEQQQETGELTPEVAADLRRRYEAEAAEALSAIAARSKVVDAAQDTVGASPIAARPRTPSGRQVTYAVGIATSVAAAVMVPKYVVDRPPGGFVTGNEVTQQTQELPSGSPSAPRNLASVTDAEMERVVEANPDVIGMRLALAGRYADKGRNDLAAVHYTKVLDRDPGNAEAQAHLGWMMLQLDRPQEGARLVDRALRTDPSLLDALWFQANIRLYGLNDAAGAVTTLNRMRARRDLTPSVGKQVEQLRAIAVRRSAGQR